MNQGLQQHMMGNKNRGIGNTPEVGRNGPNFMSE
jgi:hypothetical protein